ncbi:MAG: DUF4350 domain-containing protein [Thermoanaerobaculia bacterium]|nr:DUF4350 domain-containing protein [Thermoanaerobaculia bacterium]
MSRLRSWVRWLPLALLLAFTALVLAPDEGADSSTLSREGGGWWALWSYAKARGLDVERLDLPLDRVFPEDGVETRAGSGVLVLGFPWQVGQQPGESDAVERHLRAGGTVLVTYRLDQFTELEPMWRILGADGTVILRSPPPASPRAWWHYRHERWALAPTEALPRGPVLELPATFAAPVAPPSARELYVADDTAVRNAPLIWIQERLKGRVVVLPSDLLTNAELRRSANADFVETLIRHLEGPWWFDEYHHGLVDPALFAEGGGRAYSWDLLLLHLALVYLLGAWALGRGFGAAWSEPPARHGSASNFLRSLGALHKKLGHHRDAARKLLDRSLDYRRGARRPEGRDVEHLRREADAVTRNDEFLKFARRLASREDG